MSHQPLSSDRAQTSRGPSVRSPRTVIRRGSLPKVPDARRPSRAAVNALRALLERHNHIVQEVDGQNDFGEDQHVTFTEDGKVTGDLVKIQIKGGRSWRRADGYAVPIGDHGGTWADGNIPVLCVVHDPDTDGLYWSNATKQLLSARRGGEVLKTITIRPGQKLDDKSIVDFVAEIRGYLSRYRGNRIIQSQLGEMAGVEFGPSDIVQHHVNVFGEDLIFWQRRGEGFATLLHSDLDWYPEHFGPEHFHPNGRPGLLPGMPVLAGTILSTAEAQWLAACFDAAQWARNPTVDDPPLDTNIDAHDNYVARRIEQHLWIEPDTLTRSIQELRTETATDHDLATIAAELEADAQAHPEALSKPWREMSDKARRLVTFYLVKEVQVGSPALPIDEQFRIVWRGPRPAAEYGFSARVGQPSTHMSSHRERVSAFKLRPGDRIYWLSRHGNERGRNVSAVWDSEETPGTVCVLFDQLMLGDTFWPEELFVRQVSTNGDGTASPR
ncbi:hypothetical protein CFN78_24885 [Amycolatopsis antarctica]|uniref:DUF4365 domain-containing protein n=1 Tax=Amycolatopsis antarctica TaxID=1854586 RepID=A0A263CWW8_9PSEU|nr:DUF4365 domain-containing protein [Amycolatopsis antarctica]OZM70633.1 hypothetical protein CFN78_24885 [Amycolatopsis antarctica]